MGGLFSSLADAGSKFASEELAPRLEAGAEHWKTVKDNGGAAEHIFNRTDEGKYIKDVLLPKYYQVGDQTTESLLKQTIQNYKDPAHPAFKQPIDIKKPITDGMKAGRFAAGGVNDSRFIALIKSVESKLGPEKGPSEANALSNALAFVLKDYHDPSASTNPNIKNPIRAPFSPLKAGLKKAGVSIESIKPSYTPVNPTERAILGTTYQTLSPLMFVSHLGSVFNGMLGTTPGIFLGSLAKTLYNVMGEKLPADDILNSTGVFHADLIREAKYLNRFDAQGRDAILGSNVVKHIYDVAHLPLMSKLTRFRLLLDSTIAKNHIEDAARRYTDLVKKNGPQATRSWKFGQNYRWVLQQAGLDPDAIIEQGGKLTDAQYKTAVYKFVNDFDFLHKSINRSMFLQATPTGRILGTYHSFVTNQAKLMSRAMFRDWSQRGAGSVARNLAIGGIIMPAMGEAINIFQQSYRGQPAGDTIDRDLDNLQGNNGLAGYAQTYFDGMAHFGGFGIYGHFVRGALTHNLAQAAAGPLGGSAIDLLQDTATATLKTGKKLVGSDTDPISNDDFAPTERDIMYDTPGLSLLAQFLAHRMLPNAKDNPEADPLNLLYQHIKDSDNESSSTN